MGKCMMNEKPWQLAQFAFNPLKQRAGSERARQRLRLGLFLEKERMEL